MRAALLLLLLLSACAGSGQGSGAVGESADIECAPFARAVSGVDLYGEAAAWWDEAEGRYQRSATPTEGAVLVSRRSGRLPSGHVSVVSRVIAPREIHVTQANWVHHRIGRDDTVLDVSPDNDWSAVRVWWAPSGTLGATTYPTYGFILP